MQGVSEPALGTRPVVRTPSWSKAQGVLTPVSRAQPGEPPLWSRFVYVGLGKWACFPPRETLDPRIYSFVPTTNKQSSITKRLSTRYPELALLSALGHINSQIPLFKHL